MMKISQAIILLAVCIFGTCMFFFNAMDQSEARHESEVRRIYEQGCSLGAAATAMAHGVTATTRCTEMSIVYSETRISITEQMEAIQAK